MLRKTVWVSTLVVAATVAGLGGALAQYRGGGYAPDYYYGGYGGPGYGGGAYADPYGGRGAEPTPEPRRYREQSYDYDRAPPPAPYGYGYDQGPADPYYPDQGGGRETGRKASDLDLREGSQEATKTEVENTTRQPPGTIVINTAERHLYFVEPNGQAIRYGIGVGREGFAWKGTAQVKRKSEWPDWIPPSDMLKRRPDLPTRMSGGIENPLGARAMYLFQGNKDTMFRIHGTNEPDSIGKAMSSGCIRMMNNDVIDLYSRVPVGTKVVVL